MRSRHSFGIDFIIRRCKEDKTKAFIYARICVDEERKEVSLKEQILASNWDAKQEIVKGKSIEVKAINQTIEDVRFKIKEKYRMLCDSEALITAETVKQAYVGIHTLQKGYTLAELLDYFRRIWEAKLRDGGFKNYNTTISYVKIFLQKTYGAKDFYLSQVNTEFLTELEYYIRHNPIKDHDRCEGNGLAKHIQRFKRIINWAVEDLGWLKSNPVAKYNCPVKKSKRKKLDIQHLVILEQKCFQDPALSYVKDLFLFSCYTGFAYADVMQLSKSHFEWDTDGTVWCKLYRLKSDVLSSVPLMRDASQIVSKYRDSVERSANGNIFPYITNQCINRHLKIIQAACEFDIPLSFHVARHTFGKTVALKNGVPLETVQLMMGHTKIATTQIYAEVDEEKIIDDMTGINEKLNAKRDIVRTNLLSLR